MKKIYILSIALLSVFALGATLASGASAETVWLVGTAKTAVAVPATIEEGSLKVDVLSGLLGLVLEFTCSGEFTGTLGPNGQDEITKVLSLTLVEIGALGALGTGLDCAIVGTPLACTNAAKLVEIWPDNLPWGSLIELMAAGEEEFLDIIGLVNGNEKEPGFDLECENSNMTFTENLCESLESLIAVLTNLATDVLGVFLEQDQVCGEGLTAHVTGEGLIVLSSGLSLQVSEG